jgi:PAS domain S-box-containing protein
MSSEDVAKFDGAGLEGLLRQLHDTVVFVDPSGKILLTNREQELGVQTPSVRRITDLGCAFQMFRRDGRRYETAQWPVLRSARTGEVIVDEEFFRRSPDGGPRSFICSSAPICGEDGQIVAAVMIERDITEQKHSRERLAYLLPMLDHTQDAVVAADAQWHVIAWTQGAERMYGWTAEEALAQSPNFVRVDWSGQQGAARMRQLHQRSHWRGEGTAKRKDGSKVSIEAVTAAIRDPHGEITGYLGIHRDITARKRAEAASREANRRTESILESITDSFVACDRRSPSMRSSVRTSGRNIRSTSERCSTTRLTGRSASRRRLASRPTRP